MVEDLNQHVFAAALGVTQRDRAGTPANVVETDSGDLAATKPEIESAAHNGVSAPHGAAGFAERADQLLNFFGRQRLG